MPPTPRDEKMIDRNSIQDLKDYMKILIDGVKNEMILQKNFTDLEIENIKTRLCFLETKSQPKSWQQDLGLWAIKGAAVFVVGLILLWAQAGFPALGK